MSPVFHRAASIGLFACAIGSSPSVPAVGLLDALGDAPPAALPQWPVLRNPSQSVQGLFGGIVSAYNVSGQLESATLLILPTGYTAPVLGNGALATFALAYFDQPGCKGREYLAPSGQQAGLLPFPGVVYRSMASGQPAYVPQGRQPASAQIRSALHLDAQQGIRCEPLQQTLPLLAAESNVTTVTGMNREGELGPLTLGIESAAGMVGKRDRRSESGAFAGGSGSEVEVLDEPQDECSPGCLTEAVGNGSCDIACYFESCRFDGGDCASLDKDELDAALANMCSPGCNQGDIGDGFCDAACQTEACGQDGGDCEQNTR